MRFHVVAVVFAFVSVPTAAAVAFEGPVDALAGAVEVLPPPAPVPLAEVAPPPAPEAIEPVARLAPLTISAAQAQRVRDLLETLDGIPVLYLLPDGALRIPPEAIESGAPLSASDYVRAPPTRVAFGVPATSAGFAQDAPSVQPEPSAPRARAFSPAATAPGARAMAFAPPAPEGGPGEAALVAGAAGLGALALVGFALYHRIRPHATLDNETRKSIFEAVCAQPGLGVHELAKLSGVSYSTATYHLERLVGAGMLVMTPDGNKLCYYKNGGAFTESERRILPLVKNDEAAKLFEAILDTPGTYRAALAERLGVTATTINWHLRRLRDAGLVDETRAGRSAYLYARADAMRDAFASLAIKVGDSDPEVAGRLRRYAQSRDAEPTAAGA